MVESLERGTFQLSHVNYQLHVFNEKPDVFFKWVQSNFLVMILKIEMTTFYLLEWKHEQ